MTAKERFLSTKDAEAFSALVQSQVFLNGLDAAQIEYMDTLPPPKNEFEAQANGIRLDAMRWFRSTLMTISVPTPKKAPVETTQPNLKRT